jgi:hypothetical protein
MTKTKFILINSIIWILLAAVIVSIAIEVVWMIVGSFDYIPVRRLFFNFVIGLMIGMSVVLLNLFAMAFKKKPLFGYVLSIVCVFFLLLGVYIHTGLTIGDWSLDAKWFIIFIISEGFTIPVIYLWKKQILFYNMKLEQKKASLKSCDKGFN